MPWVLQTMAAFDRQARKFLKRHPDLRARLADVLVLREQDPFAPSLRLHALTGKLEGLQAVRINYSNRVVLRLQIEGQEILLLDIGSHDAVYR
ncbi:type II toxin-antitoxin system RelE/ParE family toxin [Thioalkalivibrio paradoxus]|uniref:Plasmid stabilization protein n=1 Tax=Thioalkalivibrio paradoxus ARh 1 TaxID=713585 RepID=W0DFZ8_9GAMM|nr:type II toxin-antitoxin system YafQ family toxin [Thioalkalivibrio paradoxus]AHE97281.1 plasmid stabilization protein [Thioalkalivibrio paradoxus ARh 1]